MRKLFAIAFVSCVTSYQVPAQKLDPVLRNLVRVINDRKIVTMNEFIKAAGCYVKDSTDLGFGGKRFHCRQPFAVTGERGVFGRPRGGVDGSGIYEQTT